MREESDLHDRYALALPVALFPPVSSASLESGIGDRGIHVHHIAGLHMARQIGEVSLHARLPFLTS